MLSNAYFLAKFRFDTAENEPAKKLQNFASLEGAAEVLAVAARGARDADLAPAAAAWAADLVFEEREDVREAARRQFLAKFRQNVARFWLYRYRCLQENTRFAAFSKSTRLSSRKF